MRQHPGLGGDRAPAESLFDDAIIAAEPGLDDAGPSLLEGESSPIDGVAPPRDGISVTQNGLHGISWSPPQNQVRCQRESETMTSTDQEHSAAVRCWSMSLDD